MSGQYMMVLDVAVRPDGCGVTVWHPSGDELGSRSGERPEVVPAFLILEAMAQCAGRTLAAGDLEPGVWLLAAIQDAKVEPAVRWNDQVEFEACVGRTAASFAVVDTWAKQAGEPVARARLTLVHRST